MAVEQAVRPERNLGWLLGESNALSLGILVVGGLSLALVTIGVSVVLVANGFTPVDELIRGFKSNEVETLCFVGIALGALAVVVGTLRAVHMPTKVSREQAIAGAVLGVQGIFLGAMIFWFSEGSVDVFARNYLDFDVLRPQMDLFLQGAKNTIFLAFSAEALGIVLGLLFAVLAISKRSVVRAPARTYINFFRGTPLVWQIIFIGVGLPLGLGLDIGPYQAAIIALTLNTGAYAAEVFRAGIRSIDRGQLEAARGLGMSYLTAMRYAVVPQAIRRVIPPLMNEFVILIKDTSLVIVLGLTQTERELMSVGNFGIANSANATFLVMTGLGYLAISLPLIGIVNAVERRLRSGLVGVGA